MAIRIEVEGIDGSSKTTSLDYIYEQLTACNLRVLKTREVGAYNIPVCQQLRKIVLSPESNMDGRAMELVFAAMRIENGKYYDKADREYDVILSDRGFLSHLSYTDHNVNPEFSKSLYMGFLENESYLPDEVLFLDVNPEIAQGRIKGRGEKADVIEEKGMTFQRNVANSFGEYINRYDKLMSINKVDANGSLMSVQAGLDNYVDYLLSKHFARSGK